MRVQYESKYHPQSTPSTLLYAGTTFIATLLCYKVSALTVYLHQQLCKQGILVLSTL